MDTPSKPIRQSTPPAASSQSTADYPRTDDGSAPSSFLRVELHDSTPTRIGDYTILRVLGEGGMGTVYLAEDVRLGRKAAIKTMKPEVATPDNRERFFREARAAAAVEHDNVVPIWHVGESADGSPFIAMPFLQGEMLETRLKREAVSPLAVLLKVALEVAEGLAAAHARGLIHRDIKPANVWLEGDPAAGELARQLRRCKILDFGLARSTGAEELRLTSSGMIVGTPACLAPEQARGERVDHRCDLFSLGVMLYRMATGRMPFAGSNMMALLTALATVDPPPPLSQNPRLPPALSDLIERLMQKDPARRLQSAAEVTATIRQIERQVSGSAPSLLGVSTSLYVPRDGVPAVPVTKATPGEDPAYAEAPATAPRRMPTRRAALALVGSLGLAGSVALLWRRKSGRDVPTEWPGDSTDPMAGPLVSPEPQNWPSGLAKPFVNSIGMRFARIPPGKFMRGSPKNNSDGSSDELPQREIQICQAFYLGIYEVTQAEYQCVMGGTSPSQFKGDFLPVETLTYMDAVAFCEKLSARAGEMNSGRLYRLPAEAEWEYACRGGADSHRTFHVGDSLTPEQANIGPKLDKTTRVGSYPPNAFGLYDMHGNVYEWCADWYDAGFYAESPASPARDPQGPSEGTTRVARGGDFGNSAGYSRSAFRGKYPPSFRYAGLGFRVALVPSNKAD